MQAGTKHLTGRGWLALVLSAGGALCGAGRAQDPSPSKPDTATLEETRLLMSKWLETQQIISKERKDWQQGKEILTSRIEVAKKEVASLAEKIKLAEKGAAEAEAKRKLVVAENDQLKAVTAGLADAVTRLEAAVRRLHALLPEPVRTKVQPLYERIPEDPAKARVSVAERFQNVLGILNDANKANQEITIAYEVHQLADGKPSEVKTIYLGLAQAYFVSARGEAGIGRPGKDGWQWEPAAKGVASEILTALEIIQGKHTPAFVPLPMKLQ